MTSQRPICIRTCFRKSISITTLLITQSSTHSTARKMQKLSVFLKTIWTVSLFVEFIGLRAKMYSFLFLDGSSKQTAKGTKKAHMKKHVFHEQYRDCLLNEKTTSARFWTIRSFAHQLMTYETNKTALSPFDDKRYLLGRDGRTLAYGH